MARKKKAVKLTKETITDEMLDRVAENLNEAMGLDPAIPFGEGVDVDALENDIIEAASDLREEDELLPRTIEILQLLDVDVPGYPVEEEAEEEPPKKAPAKKKDKPAANDSVEIVGDVDFHALLAEAKKLADLKDLVAEYPDVFEIDDLASYKGLAGPRELRKEMLACLPEEAEEAPASKKPAAKKKEPAAKKAPTKKKAEGKRESNVELAIRLTEEGASDADFKKAFEARYENKDAEYVEKRISIYKALAKKGGK